MAFSYNSCNGTQDQIDLVRLLVSDTQNTNHVFEDSEILGAYSIHQATFQSSQFYSGPGGRNIPSSPISYLRVAALLLDALAANKSRLASIKNLLDVKLDSSDAAIQLRATAKQYRDTDDNSGAFVVIEQVQRDGGWSFGDRWWGTVMRANAS